MPSLEEAEQRRSLLPPLSRWTFLPGEWRVHRSYHISYLMRSYFIPPCFETHHLTNSSSAFLVSDRYASTNSLGSHWSLLVIDAELCIGYYCDSISAPQSLELAREILSKLAPLLPSSLDHLEFRHCQGIPRQTNSELKRAKTSATFVSLNIVVPLSIQTTTAVSTYLLSL